MPFAHGKDYIPARDADFNLFFKKLCQYVTAKTTGPTPEWTDIPAAAVTELNAAYADWYTAYSKTLGEHSSEDIKEKSRVHRRVVHILRGFIQRYLKYVSDHDKDEMDLPLTDSTKTPILVPEEHVRLMVEPVHTLEHKITWEVEENGSKANIYGYDGVVLAKRILEAGEEVPTDADTLTTTRLLTKNNVIEHYRSGDQGKRASYAACWQNEKGEMGVWNGITTVVIP
ncbi:hypothetical protein FACS1894147_04210 [Spirochaetia bacterium]|nr:hypothetical protein FACS1894147_04210 [Spirochaetia bacterium]